MWVCPCSKKNYIKFMLQLNCTAVWQHWQLTEWNMHSHSVWYMCVFVFACACQPKAHAVVGAFQQHVCVVSECFGAGNTVVALQFFTSHQPYQEWQLVSMRRNRGNNSRSKFQVKMCTESLSLCVCVRVRACTLVCVCMCKLACLYSQLQW